MQKWVVIFSTLFMMSCAAKNIEDNRTKPKLVMGASQTSLGVSFYAQLLGHEGKQYKFYCPEQLWEFGDGASRQYVYNCADYNPRDPWLIKRVFRQYYTYPEKGEYEAKLTLLKNGIPIAVSTFTVNIN